MILTPDEKTQLNNALSEHLYGPNTQEVVNRIMALKEDNLDISNLELTNVPLIPKWVKSLNISNNNITGFSPDAFSQNLKRLNISNNKLQTISVWLLPNTLEYLDIQNNYIDDIPDDKLASIKEIKYKVQKIGKKEFDEAIKKLNSSLPLSERQRLLAIIMKYKNYQPDVIEILINKKIKDSFPESDNQSGGTKKKQTKRNKRKRLIKTIKNLLKKELPVV
jgi:hypothetical protein